MEKNWRKMTFGAWVDDIVFLDPLVFVSRGSLFNEEQAFV